MSPDERVKSKKEKEFLQNGWFEITWGRYFGDLNFGNSGDKCDLSVRLKVKGEIISVSVQGVGEFDDYYKALKKVLVEYYPKAESIKLISYAVPKIFVGEDGSAESVTSCIELQYNGEPLTFQYKSRSSSKAGVYALVKGLATCLDHLYSEETKGI